MQQKQFNNKRPAFAILHQVKAAQQMADPGTPATT